MPEEYSVGFECSCLKGTSATCPGGGELNAKMSVDAVVNATATAECELNAPLIRARSMGATMEFLASLDSEISSALPFEVDLEAIFEVDAKPNVTYAISQSIDSESEILTPNTDKVAGTFEDFICQEKLYPVADLPIQSGFTKFVGAYGQTDNLYSFIDEGVYQGLMKDGGDSLNLSDDAESFIRPDTIHTEGIFQYSCLVNNVNIRPDSTAFRIRVSAPLETYESKIPPLYTVFNIRLSDPSGNLIVKYQDIQLRGDSCYATYSSTPEINIVDIYGWSRRITPDMAGGSGYRLTFNVRAVALDDPFTAGFDEGFEENYFIPETFDVSGNNYLALDGSPLSTQEQRFINPSPGFKISAVEICNSGGYGPRIEDFIPAYVASPEKGRRLERSIMPSFMPLYDFDTGIYPDVDTVWEDDATSAAAYGITNEDRCSLDKLLQVVRTKDSYRYIKLKSSAGAIADSGKLILKFGSCSSNVDEITPGAFNFEFDQNTKPIWWTPSGAFNVENRTQEIHENDFSFYNVDTITLKVLAKKESGTRDYILDVVGYSDDKLLHRTSAVGGFIQNPSSVQLNDQIINSFGQHPVISGFYGDNSHSVLAGKAISEKESYFEASGNDHYKLTPYPTVDSTEFKWYEVPLQIIDENVKLGLSRDFSLSSFLEHVYLDIFPLPTGASIAAIELAVRYAPANAVNLYSQGGDQIGKIQEGRSEAAIFPSQMASGENFLNAGSGYAPLSRLEDLPHLYGSPSTLKSNYSRRWRGCEGTVAGPYRPSEFGFGFENPVVDYPFMSGYFKFENTDGNIVLPSVSGFGISPTSGEFSQSAEIYQNIGWRYSGGSLFEQQAPGFSGQYLTSDWTSLSSGAVNFVGNPLYGKIADAFDNIARVSSSNNISFGSINTDDGFSLFIRMTPDINVSGSNYNLFNSGIIASKDGQFYLGYSGGYLHAYANDTLNNVVSVVDTVPFDSYQYPLNIILTYGDLHKSTGIFQPISGKVLKLYTDNELAGTWDILRATSDEFDIKSSSSDLIVGHSPQLSVGMNMLVSEIGISAYNILESNSNKDLKEVDAEQFLQNSRVKFFNPEDSHVNDRYKLWDRVNEDTYNDWEIGDFKFCQFSPAFYQWQKRPNKEQIIFNIKHHGSGYSSYLNDLPSVIDGDVSYHTQIENDFLRFHLSDVPDSFYAANRRITKNLPCGYTFSDKSILVETVVDHEGGDNISWEGCSTPPVSGARLIVSLYTKKQEPYWTTDEPNWGLINRKVHYLKPNSCIQKLESTFNYQDYLDTTESWAVFPNEPIIKDFSERLFSEDINDMFLQYDLVYPSGSPFESKIRLHSAHVRMVDANLKYRDVNSSVNLFSSGAFPADSQISLNIGGFPREENDSIPLNINVPLPYDVFIGSPSGFTLNVSGAFNLESSLPLYIPPQSGYQYFNLSISGELPSASSGALGLSVPLTFARYDSSDDNNPITSLSGSGEFFGMPLTAFNGEIAINADGPYLSLNTFGASGSVAIRDFMSMNLGNSIKSTTPVDASGTLNINLLASSAGRQSRFLATMPMYINAPNILKHEMPLYIHNPEPITGMSGQMNLSVTNFTNGQGTAYTLWDNENYGTSISVSDNYIASVDSTNEIRGVDLMAYGSCDGDSPSKAIDERITTDCTVWREAICNDAGVIRAKQTYSNSGAINFSGGLGYEGNYYGIRKYSGLIPSVAYSGLISINPGSSESIDAPRNFEEWEYGYCGPDFNAESCCTEDCDQTLSFSGVKLIADDSNLLIDPELLVESGRTGPFKYGSVVSVSQDIMAIAAPRMDIPEYDQYRRNESGVLDPGLVTVSDAGAVFLYRRDQETAGKKAQWKFLEQVMLPIGFRKDYIQRSQENLLTFDTFSISGSKWQIGQEGRQFGSSIDITSSGNREVLVVGAPRAKWNRSFQDINTSGIPSACILFTDLFRYNKDEIASVASEASRFNILWKYFSAPWNPGPNEWYPEIQPKVIVLQLTYSDLQYPVVPKDEESWLVHRYIPRLDDLDLLENIGSGLLGGSGNLNQWISAARPVVYDSMFSGVMDAFYTAFPGQNDLVYSGIPAIMGMFKEQSGSTAGALKYADQQGNVYDLYDRFSKFYLDYSYQSGVYDPTTLLPQSGYLNTITGRSENWATTTRELLSETFDSGNLSTTFTNSTLNRDFITSGVGQEWASTHGSLLQEFQVPPASGGRVYIFENERGNFNCIQVILSPNDQGEFSTNPQDYFGSTYGKSYNDRFGHSVAVSQNGEVVSIGSPWNETPCRIFERDDSENDRVYSSVLDWCKSKNKNTAILHYNQIVNQSGILTAQVSTYDFLSASDRFEFRNDVNFWGGSLPTPYKLRYTYSYNDINYIGTRRFLPEQFAPTSRLGWSTSVNNDGDVVVFGAPTDSFNEFEDTNIWGDGQLSWASYQHAGAVRVFESRKYTPHSGVVELGLFGNLDRSTHEQERLAGYYDGMGSVFSPINKYWRRTDFSEVDIPTDAGLAFIITPEVDFASDEVIENIKDWLALGDRNLVLVGNDPVWEENGLYSESNEIINKILSKLGSRMRITSAASRNFSLPECVSQQDLNSNKYNITAAKVPSYSAGVTVGTGNYYAKGVGDIRIDLSRDNLTSYLEYMNCPEGASCDGEDLPVINTRCEFPLSHMGDLRAEWSEQCLRITPTTCNIVTYKKNWPLLFNNFSPECDNPPIPFFDRPNQEPVPVLTTAEHLPPSSWYQPATSGFFCDYRTIYEWRISQRGSTSYRFNENNIDEIAFNIEQSGEFIVGNYDEFDYSGDFIDPAALNGRDGILQGIGTSYYPEHEETVQTVEVYPESILGLVESGKKDSGDLNNSKVYIMASQWSEDDFSRGILAATENDDKNTEFYINMAKSDCVKAPVGIQINGFTGRTSLKNAYFTKDDSLTTGHRLADKLSIEFTTRGGRFEENKSVDDINDLVDFVWVAHPAGKPTNEDLQKIKSWLDLGNKKLIITYNAAMASTRQQIANNVDYLCSGLNITSRPILTPSNQVYAVTDRIIDSYNPSRDSQLVNTETDSIVGCENGYEFTFPNYDYDTKVDGLHFSNQSAMTSSDPADDEGFDKRVFVPLSGGQDFEKIIWWNVPVTEDVTIYPTNRWKIDGEAVIEFPAEVDSGYRLFVNWVSEGGSEKFNICGYIEGATVDTGTGSPADASSVSSACGSAIDLSKTTLLTPSQSVYNIRANEPFVRIRLNTNIWSSFIPEDEIVGGVPKTPRLISISGCPLPIITETVITTTSGEFPVGVEPYNCRWIVNPERSGIIPGVSRPVSNKSNIYCNPNGMSEECTTLGDNLIENGPVVVAEEFENFSSFSAGKRRSKIIVIADSTMVQGQCPHYLAPVDRGNQEFIRSLYPQTLTASYGSNLSTDFVSDKITSDGGTNWFFAQKIRSPERGSPAKYHAISGAVVQNMISPLYGGGGVTGNLQNYTDQEDYYDPTTLNRPLEIKDPQKVEKRLRDFNNIDALGTHGLYPRFSGDFLSIIADNPTPPLSYSELLGEEGQRTYITDAQIGGGLNDLMKINNTDYLDLDVYYSGCLGDLFGFSVDLSSDKLIVGSPFNAFHTEGAISGVSGIVQWHEVENDPAKSAVKIASDGGAGAAFIFSRTGRGKNAVSEFLPWEFTQKLKPSSVNIGITDFSPSPSDALTREKGPHSLSNPSLIIDLARRSDNFGLSVSIDCDMAAVGAPNHDFETLHAHLYSGSVTPSGFNTAFQRKSFNAEYDIPGHEYYDLGSSGVRVDQFNNLSGVMVLNNGAVFTFRNELVDFPNRTQEWVYAEKLFAQGYKDRSQSIYGDDGLGGIILVSSGTENDNFGKSVAIDRGFRGDSDYCLVAGAPNHVWPTSGDHPSQNIYDAGSAYTFDAMLRGQIPIMPESGGWMDFHLFGQKKSFDDTDRLEGRVYHVTNQSPQNYHLSGVVFSNSNGDIFLEVSGFDPSSRGLIAHRPYVESVKFDIITPPSKSDSFGLFTQGKEVPISGDMNLSLIGPDTANVYNNLNLYSFGTSGFSSGTMPLFTEAPSGTSDSLNLNLTSTQTTNTLDLRIRGY